MVGVRCVVLLALPGIVACGAPDIRFTDGGSGSSDATTHDGAEASADANEGDVTDAAHGDAPGDGPGAEGGCPMSDPLEGGVCCSSGLWCGGYCTPGACTRCPSTCTTGEVCCIPKMAGKPGKCSTPPCP